ncbi:MAG: hypothetical protein WB439_16145 [Acidobacteriaceae bacterium]
MMLEVTLMESIWNKTLERRFWISCAATLLLAILALLIYPTVSGFIEWRLHQTVMYRGKAFRLPAGWVDDPQGLPLTVMKPSSSMLNFDNSEVEITVLHQTAADPEQYFNWMIPRLERMIGAKPFELPPPTMQEPALHLRCLQLPDARPRQTSVSCFSENAVWSFNFRGRRSDLDDAVAIMRTFAADKNPPR